MLPREGILRKILKILYFSLQLIINILHAIIWKIVGRPTEYEASAEVLKILLKFKPCNYTMYFCNKEDFLVVHESFSHPDIVLQDNIYLYCLTESQACFVDCGQTDVFNDFSFTWKGLNKAAIRMITMPLSSFHAVANNIPKLNIPVLVVHSTGRCGSTLLANLFKDIPNSLSLSEAPVFTDITEMSRLGKLPLDELKKLCQSSHALIFKHANARKSELIFMKSVHIDLFICDILFEVIPSMKQVFLYRQPLPTIRSYEKLQAAFDWEVPVSVDSLKFFTGIDQHRLTEGSPTISDEFIKNLANFGRYSLKLAFSLFAAYNQLVKQGYPIKAIKYEDIVRDPRALFSGLLNHALLKSCRMTHKLAPNGAQDKSMQSFLKENLHQLQMRSQLKLT